MEQSKKVIVVEDDAFLRDSYAGTIVSGGYEVDKATNLEEALSLIRSKTYHVALVDLSLQEHPPNSDGLKVLKYIDDLNEGTKTIICSGQESKNLIAETFEQYGITKYIVKPEDEGEVIQSDGYIKKGGLKPAQIITPVNDAYSKCVIRNYGSSNSVTKFLAGSENLSRWEFNCLSALKPAGGASGLLSFLDGLLRPLAPLMPERETNIPMTILEGATLKGDFWSKGIGCAISVLVFHEKQGLKSEDDEFYREHKDARLSGFVYRLRDRSRDDFIEKL